MTGLDLSSPSEIRRAIEKLEKRRDELRSLPLSTSVEELRRQCNGVVAKIDDTLSGIFGSGTDSYQRYAVHSLYPTGGIVYRQLSAEEIFARYRTGILDANAKLEAAVVMLKERLNDAESSPRSKTRRAIDGLDLHRDIEDAAGELYRDGHYSSAVLEAAKALTALVQRRSGYTQDGADLMNNVFSVGNPILKLNDLTDESDRNEQKGFAMILSGIVTALRNPRAHKRIEDDAEEAVEFIAFMSLLARRVDKAMKVPKKQKTA